MLKENSHDVRNIIIAALIGAIFGFIGTRLESWIERQDRRELLYRMLYVDIKGKVSGACDLATIYSYETMRDEKGLIETEGYDMSYYELLMDYVEVIDKDSFPNFMVFYQGLKKLNYSSEILHKKRTNNDYVNWDFWMHEYFNRMYKSIPYGKCLMSEINEKYILETDVKFQEKITKCEKRLVELNPQLSEMVENNKCNFNEADVINK